MKVECEDSKRKQPTIVKQLTDRGLLSEYKEIVYSFSSPRELEEFAKNMEGWQKITLIVSSCTFNESVGV